MSTDANPDVFGWRWGDDVVDVNSQTYLAGNNVSFEIPQADLDSTFFYLRIGIENDGDMSASSTYILQVEDPGNPGSWANVTNSSSFVQAAGSGTAEADQTTVTTHDIVGGAGTDVDGLFVNGVPGTISWGTNLGGGDNFDLVGGIKFIGADLPGGETLNFRITHGGTPITDDTSGITCTIQAAGITETPGVGALTLTGQVPRLATGVNVAAGSGVFTGFAPTVTIAADIIIAVPVGSLTLTGFAPTVEITHIRLPATGTLVLTGLTPTLVQTDNHIRAPPLGTLTLTGFVPGVTITQMIPVPAGTGVFTGFAPTAVQTFSIDIPVGSLTVTGFAPTVIQEFSVDVPVGSLALTGFVPTVNVTQSISVPLGTGTFTGQVPTVIQTFSADIPAGSLSLTGFVPTLVQEFSADVPVGSLTLTGFAPTVNVTQTIAVPVGSLTLAGQAPTAIQTFSIDIPAGSGVFTGFAPTLIQTFSIPVPLGTAVFSGSIPTLNITTTVDVPVGSGVLDGKVPTVVQTFSVDVPVGSGVLSGFAPTLFREDTVSPGVGSLALTGQVPTVFISGDTVISPGVGSLSLTGFAPTVIGPPIATISGTASDGILETEVVAGGETIIITLTDATWVVAFDAVRQDIIDGLDSAQSETTGWNNEVRDKEVLGAVVRTSSTVVTITLSASSAYNITANETVTVTVPASAVDVAIPLIATPTIGITFTDLTKAHTVKFTSQATQTGLFWEGEFWESDFWQNQFWFGEAAIEQILFESDSASVNFSSRSASVIMECVGEPTEVGFILLEDGFNLLLEDGGQVQLENV